MKKLKKINWKNVLSRMIWTFFEGFFSALTINNFTKEELQAGLIGAVAMGLSMVKTVIVEICQMLKEED